LWSFPSTTHYPVFFQMFLLYVVEEWCNYSEPRFLFNIMFKHLLWCGLKVCILCSLRFCLENED
jgi:hypothetical protein